MTTYQHINTGVKVEMLSDVAGVVNYRDAGGINWPMHSITFHEHYKPCAAVPAEPELAPEPARGLYVLTSEEHATVLAALRYYQRDLDTMRTSGVHDIATNRNTITPLDARQIDKLFNSLNHSGLDIGGVCEVIGRGSDDPYVAAADRLYNDGTVTIDGQTVVSESDDGAYVMGWVWVNNDEVENG